MYKTLSFYKLPFLTLILALYLLPTNIIAEGDENSFLPTWKLLNSQEKQQFIAGYIFGWKDAAKITDIAIRYVRDNPNKAVEGLERIRTLYDVSEVKPDRIAREVDSFFADPQNRDATLSAAISAAREKAH